MKRWIIAGAFAAAGLAGCMASSPPPEATPPESPPSPLGSPFSDRRAGLDRAPLIIDRTDLRIGTTVQYTRIPSATELYDLNQLLGVAHVVLTLPAWPANYATLQVLNQAPPEADVIVVLPGYPPSREAAEAWNLVDARVRLRVVVLVQGPPPSAGVVADLNTMRGLERVIAEMDMPSRTGFERLQRPLSFRKLVE